MELTWKSKVWAELTELEERAAKLHTFISSPERKLLDEGMQKLLKLQYQTMTHYADILRHQLDLMVDHTVEPVPRQEKVIMVATSTMGRHLIGGLPQEPLVETRLLTPHGPETIVNEDILGECLFKLIHRAWAAGHDPTTIFFKVKFE